MMWWPDIGKQIAYIFDTLVKRRLHLLIVSQKPTQGDITHVPQPLLVSPQA